MMSIGALYEYINNNKIYVQHIDVQWHNILNEPIDEKLIYSPTAMSLWKLALLPFFKLYFRLEVKGRENIPASPVIFAPIHQSFLDGFLVLATLPFHFLKRSFFFSFKGVSKSKVYEFIALNGQNILVDTNENLRQTLQQSAFALKEENNLVIFPEGARSRDRELLEFKPFFAILAKTFNVPIVPIVVDGGFEALRSGTSFPKPKKIKVSYLQAIYPQNLSYEEIVIATKEAIAKEMKENPLV